MRNFNWKERRERKAFLALADGSVFHGWSFGAPHDSVGEAVFNTGMTGYQEIVSDPSYAGQFVCLTTPEIGNYGCNADDAESRSLFLNGMIIHELNEPSNYRSEEAFSDCLIRAGKPGIAGINTRALTLLLREKGSQKAYLHVEDSELSIADAVKHARTWDGLDGQDYAAKVTTEKSYCWFSDGDFHVVVLDCGVKYNILRKLAEQNLKLTVVPARTSAANILALKPDGVFISNGPADPSAVDYAAETVRALIGKVPVMGICLGHQLLGIACGGECKRLKFGHHGCNHPVKDLRTGEVAITSQNHNYALDPKLLPPSLEVTHLNLNDGTVEGIRHRTEPAFSVQYHPEAAPGPHDASKLFIQFRKMMENC